MSQLLCQILYFKKNDTNIVLKLSPNQLSQEMEMVPFNCRKVYFVGTD